MKPVGLSLLASGSTQQEQKNLLKQLVHAATPALCAAWEFTALPGSAHSLELNGSHTCHLDIVARRACNMFGPPCGGASSLNSSEGIYFMCTKTSL